MTPQSPAQTTVVPPTRKRWTPWIVAGLVVAVVLVITVLFAAPNPQAGSTYSRSLTGYRQWFDYMQQERPVQRWRQDYSQLQGQDQTFIRIHTQAVSDNRLAPPGLDSLLPWVKQGNTLIVLAWQGETTRSPFGSRLAPETSLDLNELVQIETTRRNPLSRDQTGLLQDRYGAVVWSYKLGKGTVIRCTYPWLGANAFVDHPANYRFLATLAQQRSGTIWVDEWVHGHRDRSPIAQASRAPTNVLAYLLNTPVLALLGQTFFILLLLVWGHNHRFGALLDTTPSPENASHQYIRALASTLNAARHNRYVQGILSSRLVTTLAARLGLQTQYREPSANLDPKHLAERWAAATDRSPQELLNLLSAHQSPFQADTPHRLNDSDLLAWVTQVELLLRELP